VSLLSRCIIDANGAAIPVDDAGDDAPALRAIFACFLPQAAFWTLQSVGRPAPLEAPGECAEVRAAFHKDL
jgi:hypothetical protein